MPRGRVMNEKPESRLRKPLRPQESDLRVEVVGHLDVAQRETPALGVVVPGRVVGVVASLEPGCIGGGCEPGDLAVLPQPYPSVHPVGAVEVAAPGQRAGRLPVHEDGADLRAVRQVAIRPRHREVVGWRHARHLLGLHVEQAHRYRIGDLARQPGAPENRDLAPARTDADAAAEKQLRLARVAAGHLPDAAHREDAGVLEKERPLLRKEQVEAIQVDLLLVHLDLREVGVVGEIERQGGARVVLQIDAGVAQRRRAATLVAARQIAGEVGDDLEVASHRRRPDLRHLSRQRQAQQVVTAGLALRHS